MRRVFVAVLSLLHEVALPSRAEAFAVPCVFSSSSSLSSSSAAFCWRLSLDHQNRLRGLAASRACFDCASEISDWTFCRARRAER